MSALSELDVWLVPGSHALYGEAALATVDEDTRQIAAALDAAPEIPVRVIAKPVVISPAAIREVCAEANMAERCVGLIV
ncbi:MAG TPA: hypothetical protein VL977_02370, partial [Solirubrobacteraceae bacterium]|nr:hypothetical protein [Solirubrobacteraceae bacterium]